MTVIDLAQQITSGEFHYQITKPIETCMDKDPLLHGLLRCMPDVSPSDHFLIIDDGSAFNDTLC